MANKKFDKLKQILMEDYGCSEEDIERYLNQNESDDEELIALRKENEKLRKVIKKMANTDPIDRLFNAAASTSRRPNLNDSEMRIFDAVMSSIKQQQRPQMKTHLRINGLDIDPGTYSELGRFMGAAANGFYYN